MTNYLDKIDTKKLEPDFSLAMKDLTEFNVGFNRIQCAKLIAIKEITARNEIINQMAKLLADSHRDFVKRLFSMKKDWEDD